MVYGSGWELDESSAEFWAKVDEYVGDDPRLEEMLEGLSWALLADPVGLPNGRHLTGTLWYATLGTPPSYLVFYELEETARRIVYSMIAPAP